MTKEIKINTIVWATLVILICLSTVFAENGFTNAYLAVTVFAGFKFLAVAFQFIEVKSAHIVWKLLSILFVVIYLVGVLVLYK